MFPKAPSSVYQSPKCFVTHGSMGHIDPVQIPHKSKPWATLAQLDFIHKVDVLLPYEVPETIRRQLVQNRPPPRYLKLIMSLEQILERDFFTKFIKSGSVLMLSEGKTTVDNVFTLKEGILTMYLNRETYENAGLPGQPCGAKDNRGLKSRWVVEYHLRNPSMLHGKKGFDRLAYAAKQVLNKPLTWLFCSLDEQDSTCELLEKFCPARFTSPGTAREAKVRDVPLGISSQTLSESNRSEMERESTELYEWLSLIRLGSPRVGADDEIDQYLSRYQAPSAPVTSMRLDKLSWQGFISPRWLRETLICLLTVCPSKAWFALSASGFSQNVCNSSNEVLILRAANESGGEYTMWETKNHE